MGRRADMEQFGELLGLIPEHQNLFALHRVRNTLLLQEPFRHLGVRDGHKGI
jgi:hypothetical protein